MNNQVKNASVADILHDVCHYEDPDTSLLINTTEDGQVFVSDQEWNYAVIEETMEEALIKHQIRMWESLGYTKEQARKTSEEFHELDWCMAISHMEVEEEK